LGGRAVGWAILRNIPQKTHFETSQKRMVQKSAQKRTDEKVKYNKLPC